MNDTNFDLTAAIIEYENTDIMTDNNFDLFAHLIKTGLAWRLQGSYGRQAHYLIQQGFITAEGERTFKEQNL